VAAAGGVNHRLRASDDVHYHLTCMSIEIGRREKGNNHSMWQSVRVHFFSG
jgi:hypothetical protein